MVDKRAQRVAGHISIMFSVPKVLSGNMKLESLTDGRLSTCSYRES